MPEQEALECSCPGRGRPGEPCGLGREREASGGKREGEDCRKGGLPSTHLPEVPPLQEEPAESDKGPAGARGGFPTKEAERRPFSLASALQGPFKLFNASKWVGGASASQAAPRNINLFKSKKKVLPSSHPNNFLIHLQFFMKHFSLLIQGLPAAPPPGGRHR